MQCWPQRQQLQQRKSKADGQVLFEAVLQHLVDEGHGLGRLPCAAQVRRSGPSCQRKQRQCATAALPGTHAEHGRCQTHQQGVGQQREPAAGHQQAGHGPRLCGGLRPHVRGHQQPGQQQPGQVQWNRPNPQPRRSPRERQAKACAEQHCTHREGQLGAQQLVGLQTPPRQQAERGDCKGQRQQVHPHVAAWRARAVHEDAARQHGGRAGQHPGVVDLPKAGAGRHEPVVECCREAPPSKRQRLALAADRRHFGLHGLGPGRLLRAQEPDGRTHQHVAGKGQCPRGR